MLLSVSDLRIQYGSITAVQHLSMQVKAGEIVAVVGPNGAGKSSLLSAIAGVVPVASGSIAFGGVPLNGLSPEDILRHGVALVPEGRHIFSSMTVDENLRLGATVRTDRTAIGADIDNLLGTFPILRERRAQPAGRLSGGEQQMLAIARALLCKPTMLMLDEPSLGLAPIVIDRVYAILRQLRLQGVTILLIEQNAARALDTADRTYVLSAGVLRLSGTKDELLRDRGFDAAYFGVAEAEAAR
jgi:branched-chain amino acid transport system ATP-binding protein